MTDTVAAAAEGYAADLATLSLKMAFASVAAVDDSAQPRRNARAAAAAIAIERAGGPVAEETATEGSMAWRTLHTALTRSLSRDPDAADGGEMPRLLGDVAIQRHAQTVMEAARNPSLEGDLPLADRNLAAAVREDGGDVAELVDARARGAFHELTPDQRDDVDFAISSKALTPPALIRETDRAAMVADRVAATNDRPIDAVRMLHADMDAMRSIGQAQVQTAARQIQIN